MANSAPGSHGRLVHSIGTRRETHGEGTAANHIEAILRRLGLALGRDDGNTDDS
jgi:hypothetical protein